MELCGGTHVGRTGEIGLFKITGEGSVSAGVRRIEAVTGEVAMSRYSRMDSIVSSLSRRLKTPMTDLEEAVRKSLEDLKQAQKQVDVLQLKLAGQKSLDALDRSRRVRGIRVVAEEVADLDRSSLRQLADQLKNRLQSGVVVLGTPIDGKVSLIAMVSDDLTDRIQAHRLIRKLARLVGGGGGGRPDMAEAGGRDVARLGEARWPWLPAPRCSSGGWRRRRATRHGRSRRQGRFPVGGSLGADLPAGGGIAELNFGVH